jgi:hypothetical protein
MIERSLALDHDWPLSPTLSPAYRGEGVSSSLHAVLLDREIARLAGCGLDDRIGVGIR